MLESGWNTGYKETRNKMLQQGLGLERSQVTRDQGHWVEVEKQDGFTREEY